MNFFDGLRVLVTGAAGTIGKALTRQLLSGAVAELKLADNNELELFKLDDRYRLEKRVNCFFGDIRDYDRYEYLSRDVDVILHTAALKHVTISEISPLDAVKTNVDGTSNIIRAALSSHSVSRVIYTSSDKAANPTNVMGTTKLLGERLMTSALNIKSGRRVCFSSTRFGNVLGSKGSVAPLFYQGIKERGVVSITDEAMTRFVMSIEQAAQLVLRATELAKGGEVFVTKMPVVRIVDLAHSMIDLVAPRVGRRAADVNIEYIGKKPGEKLYEELMTQEETARAVELRDMFLIRPAFPPLYEDLDYVDGNKVLAEQVTNPYVSANEPALTRPDVDEFLRVHRVVEDLELD